LLTKQDVRTFDRTLLHMMNSGVTHKAIASTEEEVGIIRREVG
jgi:hypothetical protein